MTSKRRRVLEAEVIRRDGRLCAWCARALTPGGELISLDHVLPKAHGGSWHPANLVLACRDCNSARQTVPAPDWAAACRRRGLRVRTVVVMAAMLRMFSDPRVTRTGYLQFVAAEQDLARARRQERDRQRHAEHQRKLREAAVRKARRQARHRALMARQQHAARQRHDTVAA